MKLFKRNQVNTDRASHRRLSGVVFFAIIEGNVPEDMDESYSYNRDQIFCGYDRTGLSNWGRMDQAVIFLDERKAQDLCQQLIHFRETQCSILCLRQSEDGKYLIPFAVMGAYDLWDDYAPFLYPNSVK